ncbi:hypothetical protein FIU88_08065 [Halomonas sp. THAF12]|uniref:hypothetical protein n=1 Tax=Halomonas sp. THAF12 TaxID=2587849 RepID=UPI001267C459|nr:hypothetical protein [Halomonas sp. THAF12]QFT84928.1 hypothetical protein FIU88_08065 [Halomonas sp. THAF12]
MSDSELAPGKVLIEVISGPEGPCLSIGDESTGHRLAGPKPWGGGSVTHQFQVDVEELIREAHPFREARGEK